MTTRVAFVCVQNAGRSQMAHAFAERWLADRSVDGIELLTGGTEPAAAVHDVVVEAMAELGIDLSDQTPRAVTPDELADFDVVVTMGCSATDVCPATWNGDSRDWALDDPHGRPLREVRGIRDEVRARVERLLEELVADASHRPDA